MIRWRSKPFAVFVLLCAASIAAQEARLATFVLRADELPAGWGFVRSVYSVTPVAADFYSNYEVTYAPNVRAALLEKKFQSFSGPGRGTVFYLRFATGADAQNAANHLRQILAGEAGDNAPERLLVIGPIVSILSFANPGMAGAVEERLRKRRH